MACPSYSALGGRASASHDLSFVRTGGNVDEPLSFEVEINGNPYSFTFEANSDSFTFRTGIFDNPEFGDNPPVEVELIDGAAYNLGAVSSASIEVRDDDPPPIVSFDLFGVPGSVEEGESYSLTFSLSGNTCRPRAVLVHCRRGTAYGRVVGRVEHLPSDFAGTG